MRSQAGGHIVEDSARRLSLPCVRLAEESTLVLMLTVLMLVLAATVGLREGPELPETEAASMLATPTARQTAP